jgi:hypothetical protein
VIQVIDDSFESINSCVPTITRGTRFPTAKPTFPDFVPPMMAKSTTAAFDSPDWIFEIKLDGYRAITFSVLPASLTSDRETAWHWKRVSSRCNRGL